MQKNNRTILFLFPYPLGHAPSQRFRFEQYFDALRESGYRLETQSFLTEEAWRLLYTPGNTVRKILAVAGGFIRRAAIFFGPVQRASYVFVHREITPLGPPLLEWFIARVMAKKLVYDFDDSIWIPNTSEENRIASSLKWHSKVKSICRWSHVVSVGNRYLARFAELHNGTVIVNPTTVDTERLHILTSENTHSNAGVITIGWTGTHSTLKYLKEIEPVLVQLEERFGSRVRFLAIANRALVLRLSHFVFMPWTKEKEIDDLRQLDIGIMPLQDDAWSQGKCGLKALQYMSLGIPTVASPVGVNREIISDDVDGYLCSTSQAWFDRLSALVEDAALRKRIGDAGRHRVVDAYSTASNRSVFLSLFR